MSGIGLSGAHRTGKSTLAKAFAEAFGIKYVASVTSDVIRGYGLDPADDCDFDLRLRIQWEILRVHELAYVETKGMFITDRTPLDFLAYTLADVTRDNLTFEQGEELMRYKSACIGVINKHFNVLTVIQPGIEFIEAPGKPRNNRAYSDHINAIICGLASAEKDIGITTTYLPKHLLDINARVAAIESSVHMAFNKFERNAAKRGAIRASSAVH